MKKYISCIVLVLLCLICAMVFYANASDLWAPRDEIPEQSESQTMAGTFNDNTLSPDESLSATIDASGTFLSEYLSETNLRLEWVAYKSAQDSSAYLSCELYLDTPDTITKTAGGYILIDGEKFEFPAVTAVSTSTLLKNATKIYTDTDALEAKIDAFVTISEENTISVSGIVCAEEKHTSMDTKHKIEMENISMYPDLPSGDEIVSLAMVLRYLDYELDPLELCQLYLDKGPVGYTDPSVANVGNPQNVYNSYGCLPPVIVNAGEKFISASGGKSKIYDMSGVSINELYYQISQNKPVIVWACESFDITPSISRIWVIDGKTVHVKSNMMAMVLIGYDMENGTVTLSSPNGTEFEIEMELFEMRFSQMGSYAVLVD
ncbi:MAG: C39 family peptidase [Clostridia bacterium]|nr:C39 family peptidase [Clostridia bacterium]